MKSLFSPLLLFITFFSIIISCTSKNEKAAPAMMPQAPSPMQEHIREHTRITDTTFTGEKIILEDVLSKPVTVYKPSGFNPTFGFDILIHFHGAAFVPIYAIDQLNKPIILAVVNQGSGSSAYGKPFLDTQTFDVLLEQILQNVVDESNTTNLKKVYLSSFSAGYGAVRELLKTHFDRIDGLVILDGMHTDYIPESTPLASGGELNNEKLQGFLRFAKQAVNGDKKMLVTHSEIFPGTYASTTETSEYLINELGLTRKAVLEWGPVGMQQVSQTAAGQFQVKGFVGNTAPDHIDHLHGMEAFLGFLWEE
ncbi:MAG: hypothetical protein CMO01_29120 [Thalassobius sp.]|nr:hypothetical protein [Thalassovita sp.]